MKSKFSAVSVFSGAGGMDVGFKKAGFDILWANDLDKNAVSTYRENFGDHVVHGDITELISDLKSYEGVDLLFGGPPCQGFSVAGKMNPDDERSKLVWSFMEIVELIRPKAFVMENVRALGALSKFEAIRSGLIFKAQKLGYSVDLSILNSKDFGVPQSRERMFLVGVLNDGKHFSLSNLAEKYRKPGRSVQDVIVPLGKAGSKNNQRICNAKITIASKPVLRKSAYAGMLFNGQGRPVNPENASCTLHASMGGNRTPIIDEAHLFEGEQSWVESYHAHLMNGGEPYHKDAAPDRLRRLTVDEAIHIQTFPSDYKFIGSQSSTYKQIGNAVPCNLAESIAKCATELLNGDLVDNITDQHTTLNYDCRSIRSLTA